MHQEFKFRWTPFFLALLTLPILSVLVDFIIQNNSDFYIRGETDFRGHQSKHFNDGVTTDRPTIYFFGGSGMMWSLLDETTIEGKFENKFNVRNYSHGFQTLIESYAYIKLTKLQENDFIILHVSSSRLNRIHIDDRRLCRPQFYSVTPGDFLEAYNDLNIEPKSFNSLCYLSFLSKPDVLFHMTKNIFKSENPGFISIIPQDFEKTAKLLQEKRDEIQRAQAWDYKHAFSERWLRINEESFKTSLHIIEQIQKKVDAKGAHLLVVDTPLNKSWFDQNFDWSESNEDTYLNLNNEFNERNINYYDLRWDKRFTYADFFDHQHATQSGRIKLEPIYRELISNHYLKRTD